MSSKTILIDSNILIYAINSSSPKHKTAQAFLQANIGRMAIAHQNIFESLRVLTHKKFQSPMPLTDAIMAINQITVHCHVIAPERDTHRIAIALMQKHDLTGDKIFDAYLAASALSAGITIIATDNVKDFVKFEAVSIVNPFDS